MLKKLKIEIDTERLRSEIYNIVKIKTNNENYMFATLDSYDFFNNSVVKNDKDYTIISYNLNFWELDFCELIKVEIVYVHEKMVLQKELFLRRKPDNFILDDFEKGEN